MTEENRKMPLREKWPVRIGLAFLLAVLVLSAFAQRPPVIESVTAERQINEDHTATLVVTVKEDFFASGEEVWCYVGKQRDAADIPEDAWVETTGREARFHVPSGEYYAYAKDRYGNISHIGEQGVAVSDILAIELNYERLILPLDDTRRFEAALYVLGDADSTVTWETSDVGVASITDGELRTHAPGEVTVTATASNGLQAAAEIIVTDLFHTPVFEASKTRLPAYQYSTEEAHLLDDALASRIGEAGYATRAGTVAAARFLTLEFPYRIPYFFENGRLVNHFNAHVDGEGRYYHIGLYLSVDKYDDITATMVGPAIWGAPLTNFQNEGNFKAGGKYPNGLDCSGFITWALYNGGFDVGDVGAGDYYYRDDDLCDLGERVKLTAELIESGRIKVGDLIGQDGHIAMIVGMTDDYVYIAESSGPGVRVLELSWYYGVFNFGTYDYVMLMDSVYKQDGNLADMW